MIAENREEKIVFEKRSESFDVDICALKGDNMLEEGEITDDSIVYENPFIKKQKRLEDSESAVNVTKLKEPLEQSHDEFSTTSSFCHANKIDGECLTNDSEQYVCKDSKTQIPLFYEENASQFEKVQSYTPLQRAAYSFRKFQELFERTICDLESVPEIKKKLWEWLEEKKASCEVTNSSNNRNESPSKEEADVLQISTQDMFRGCFDQNCRQIASEELLQNQVETVEQSFAPASPKKTSRKRRSKPEVSKAKSTSTAATFDMDALKLPQCTICLKTFTNKSTLRRHEQLHTGIRFHCMACGRNFARQDYLKIHMKKCSMIVKSEFENQNAFDVSENQNDLSLIEQSGTIDQPMVEDVAMNAYEEEVDNDDDFTNEEKIEMKNSHFAQHSLSTTEAPLVIDETYCAPTLPRNTLDNVCEETFEDDE